ncbi:MAG TPA: cohesin domain-containing protein [Candidatus Paceibacterota bacterium]
MKKVIAIIGMLLVPSLASAATLSVSPSSQSVNVGDTFTVTINLDTQGSQVDGVDLRYLNYNPALLQVQGNQITPGSLMPMTLANTVNSSNGRITFSQVALGGNKYNGSGVLATVTFKAIAEGSANLTFSHTSNSTTDSNVAANGSDVLSAVVNGSYTIGSGSSSSDNTSSGGGASSGGGGGGGGGSSSGSVSNSSGYIPPIGTVSAYAPAGGLIRNLFRGATGDDVKTLQQFLVNQGYTTADNITGYYGPATEVAVKAFQSAQGIVSSGDPVSTGYGFVGPSTRARINQLLGGGGGGGYASSGLTPAQIESIRAQILLLQQQVLALLMKLQALVAAGQQ